MIQRDPEEFRRVQNNLEGLMRDRVWRTKVQKSLGGCKSVQNDRTQRSLEGSGIEEESRPIEYSRRVYKDV